MAGWVPFTVLVLLLVFVAVLYNRLLVLRNRIKNAFAQIDVQLTRRHDPIPNLVETVKGYVKHEREKPSSPWWRCSIPSSACH